MLRRLAGLGLVSCILEYSGFYKCLIGFVRMGELMNIFEAEELRDFPKYETSRNRGMTHLRIISSAFFKQNIRVSVAESKRPVVFNYGAFDADYSFRIGNA